MMLHLLHEEDHEDRDGKRINNKLKQIINQQSSGMGISFVLLLVVEIYL